MLRGNTSTKLLYQPLCVFPSVRVVHVLRMVISIVLIVFLSMLLAMCSAFPREESLKYLQPHYIYFHELRSPLTSNYFHFFHCFWPASTRLLHGESTK